MSNIASMDSGWEDADAEVLQKVKQEFYPLVKDKLMLDARRDAIIDVFIEKCNKAVVGDFTWDIAPTSRVYQKVSRLREDDAAFVSELKAELVKDLAPDHLESYIYERVEPDVAWRLKIWTASKKHSKGMSLARKGNFFESAILAGSRFRPSAYEELQSLKDDGPRTLQEMSEQRGLELLSSAIKGEQATATFACGGSIKVRAADEDAATDEGGQLSSPPVIVRWDNIDKTITRRVELPSLPGNRYGLDMLLKDCQPATFGLGGVDVLDESYRKASKLDNTQFATSFNPYDYGIVDTIAQILFPSVKDKSSDDLGLELRGVRAELYKLNIYSGPSGRFHPHVDTPRGEGQFGSLVVCLPSPHSGGELLVRHEGTTVEYNWSTANASTNCIQWAAFYSDCEHEVLEVTSGHRLTLTYNLYIREHDGGAFGRTLTMSLEQLPLHGVVKELLDQPGFLREGALLGFFCSHEYAHTHRSSSVRVPRSLKGVDMAIYAVFRALGLQVEILPVMELGGLYKLEFGGQQFEHGSKQPSLLEKLKKYRGYQSPPATSVEDLELDYDVDLHSDDEELYSVVHPEVTSLEDYKDVQTRLQSILRSRKIRNFSTVDEAVIAGIGLHEWKESHRGGSGGETSLEIRNEEWPNHSLLGVQWLNEAKHTNSALTHMAYGNEASLATYYSAAALLVIVPPSPERGPFPICRTSKRRHSDEDPAASGA